MVFSSRPGASFSIKLAAFQAGGGAETQNLFFKFG
jgi:hypothetical protein